MRINEIENKNVNVLLTADELVKLTNVMYFYERNNEKESSMDTVFHNLYAQILLASNVCQYGHMDDFATSRYIKHKVQANPNSRLKELMDPDRIEDFMS